MDAGPEQDPKQWLLRQPYSIIIAKASASAVPISILRSVLMSRWKENISCPLGGLDWAAHSGNGIDEPV